MRQMESYIISRADTIATLQEEISVGHYILYSNYCHCGQSRPHGEVDYQKVNDKYAYPLPPIDVTLDILAVSQ